MSFRDTSLNLNSIHTADGSAAVKIGNTSVVCGIKAVSNCIISKQLFIYFYLLSFIL